MSAEDVREHYRRQGAETERQRIIQIIDNQTLHYGKTHYEESNCAVCRIIQEIQGEKA